MKKLTIAGICAAVVLVLALVVYAAPGKTKGNSCMSQCMGANAEYYDAQNELTQACKVECSIGQYDEPGACLTTEDGCCVPYTDDPDCVVVECPADFVAGVETWTDYGRANGWILILSDDTTFES